MNVKTITGNNVYQINDYIRNLIQEYRKDNEELSVEIIDCEETPESNIVDAISGISLFSEQKLVVLRNLSANKELSANISTYLDRVPTTTHLIIVQPKFDKRLSYYKDLKKLTEFIEFNELEGVKLLDWVVQFVQKRGGQIARSDANYLVATIGTDQNLIKNSLDKLISYDVKISKSSIDLLTQQSINSTVFQLIESAFTGQKEKSLRIYNEQREQNVEVLQIISLMAWQLHILVLLKSAKSKSLAEIAREAGVNPYVLSKSADLARKIDITTLKKLVSDLAKIDIKSKTTSFDADTALKLYIASI